MSQLKADIAAATTAAMKARDRARVSIMRLINSELKRLEVDERRELTDVDVLAVLDRMQKQRHESERQYRDADRADLADQEAYEIGVIREFMPAPLSEVELDALVRETIAEVGATSAKDLGKVMAAVRPKVQGRADMAAVSARVKTRLN
jgi:uncharacterized protein